MQIFTAAEILDPIRDDSHITFWLAQLKKETWHVILKFAAPEIKTPSFRMTRKALIETVAPLVKWQYAQPASVAAVFASGEDALGLVLYHSENDWCRVVSANASVVTSSSRWGLVNVGERLICTKAGA